MAEDSLPMVSVIAPTRRPDIKFWLANVPFPQLIKMNMVRHELVYEP